MSKSDDIYAVIMTLYRSDDLGYFELALRSIESQQMNGTIRIYLCVDGPISADRETYLAANGKRFYKIIRNKVNAGLAVSLNRLIDVLEDENLVFRMDGDDISHPMRVAKQAAYMATHPEISLVGCQALDINEHGEVIGERRYATDPDAVSRLMGRMTSILHPTFCIRSSVFRDPAIRYPNAYLTEDAAFLVVMIGKGHQIANLDETLFSWRVASDFFVRRSDPKRGLAELVWFGKATHLHHGFVSGKYIYPLSRFIIRCLPHTVVRWLYRSNLRNRVMK
jgi:glycosyltransferase involved in cell wall biosynthesis